MPLFFKMSDKKTQKQQQQSPSSSSSSTSSSSSSHHTATPPLQQQQQQQQKKSQTTKQQQQPQASLSDIVIQQCNSASHCKSTHDALFLLTTHIKNCQQQVEQQQRTSSLSSGGGSGGFSLMHQELVHLMNYRAFVFIHASMLYEAERDVRQIVTKLAPFYVPTWALISRVLQLKFQLCKDLNVPRNVLESYEYVHYQIPECTIPTVGHPKHHPSAFATSSSPVQTTIQQQQPIQNINALGSSTTPPPTTTITHNNNTNHNTTTTTTTTTLANNSSTHEEATTSINQQKSPLTLPSPSPSSTKETNEENDDDDDDAVPEELECTLCYRVFHQPITLPCGHTFDRTCLARVFDYTSKCPLCRLQTHILPSEIPTTITLQTLIEKYYASAYRKRLEESSREDAIFLQDENDDFSNNDNNNNDSNNSSGNSNSNSSSVAQIDDMSSVSVTSANDSVNDRDVELPLFVLGDYVLYPGTKLSLHIFEPRYRLLIRRCMSGSRQFGLISNNGRYMSKYGTVAKIVHFTQLDDGRSLVETVGGRRFSVEGDPWLVDGYNVARVRFFREQAVLDSERVLVNDLSRKLEVLLDGFFAEVGPEMRATVEQKIGPVPPPENIVERSFWLASFLPLRSTDKLEMLRLTNTKDRLQMLSTVTSDLTTRPEPSCSIQ